MNHSVYRDQHGRTGERDATMLAPTGSLSILNKSERWLTKLGHSLIADDGMIPTQADKARIAKAEKKRERIKERNRKVQSGLFHASPFQDNSHKE